MKAFYYNYRSAVERSNAADPIAVAVTVMATVFDRVMVQFEEPFTFPSHHLRMMDPYDYYAFGQNYVRPLIDFDTSYLGNQAVFDTIQQQILEGHNVVLLANHQTEADPAVMALMLEHTHPLLAENLTYVAGDRVVLDPVCKPFSMGRNLLCVFSKKRLHDVPELADAKAAANRRTLKAMAGLFKEGGLLVWIAPSGGRDRPDPATGTWQPAQFDVGTVDLMRRLVVDGGPPGHLYPLAMTCYDIMPPPRQMEKELGEQRLIGYHGVGISVAPELDHWAILRSTDDKKAAKEEIAQAAWAEVRDQYRVLTAAIHGRQGPATALAGQMLSQPWKRTLPHLASSSPAVQLPTAAAAAC
eukprot:SM000247S08293  [mRNA]  locus=s247:155693:158172:- [translate_table: standard]